MMSSIAVQHVNKLVKQCQTDGVDCIVFIGDEDRYDIIESMYPRSRATERNIERFCRQAKDSRRCKTASA